MPEFHPMTTDLLLWLFGGVTPLHLVAMALVWVAVFIPGKLGFKKDPLLRVSIGIFLICEAFVTLLHVGENLSMPLTFLGGAALFFALGRLTRWLVFYIKSKKS